MVRKLYSDYKGEMVFMPLGARCSSASIIDGGLGKRSKAYPFDWIDIDLDTILKFLSIPPENSIENYVAEYFKNVNRETLRHETDNTWFPHDFPEKEDATTKYIRRFKRMFDLFKSTKNILFLTTFAHVNKKNTDVFDKIKQRLSLLVKGECIFITINLDDLDYEKENHANFHIPLRPSFDDFDQRAIEKIMLIIGS